MRRLFSIFFLAAWFILPKPLLAYSNPGQPSGLVNDYAALLSPENRAALESKLEAFRDSSSNEIAVVTIKSLDGDAIENYAVKLFEDWGIGTEKNDNGLLLLVALDDRKMRIEVGYGLEGVLPDATANQIINKTLKPALQEGVIMMA